MKAIHTKIFLSVSFLFCAPIQSTPPGIGVGLDPETLKALSPLTVVVQPTITKRGLFSLSGFAFILAGLGLVWSGAKEATKSKDTIQAKVDTAANADKQSQPTQKTTLADLQKDAHRMGWYRGGTGLAVIACGAYVIYKNGL
jgi:hypothetical protein